MSTDTVPTHVRTVLSGTLTGFGTPQAISADEPLLIRARAAVAERFPGCARAITSSDPLKNWDRGQLVQAELTKLRNSVISAENA